MPNVGTLRVLLLGTENSDSSVTGVTTGTSIPVKVEGYGLPTVFLRSVGTTSGGTILIEEADWGDREFPYSGTWSQIQSVAASSFSGTQQVAIHVSFSLVRYLRVRISSTITGGGTILASLAAQSGG